MVQFAPASQVCVHPAPEHESSQVCPVAHVWLQFPPEQVRAQGEVVHAWLQNPAAQVSESPPSPVIPESPPPSVFGVPLSPDELAPEEEAPEELPPEELLEELVPEEPLEPSLDSTVQAIAMREVMNVAAANE